MCCFFKQKTADELRISDWSSDVCSSDLDGFKRCVGIETACDHQYGIFRLIVFLIESAQLADDHTFDIRARAYGVMTVVVPLEAIGRASCRDTVCQYGYI